MTRPIIVIAKTSTIIFILESTISRDIAARNCIIEPSSIRVRLADAALARDLFPQDYHCLGDNENRPIRWMALESLQRNEYSTATDVVRFKFIYADKSKLRYSFRGDISANLNNLNKYIKKHVSID